MVISSIQNLQLYPLSVTVADTDFYASKLVICYLQCDDAMDLEVL